MWMMVLIWRGFDCRSADPVRILDDERSKLGN